MILVYSSVSCGWVGCEFLAVPVFLTSEGQIRSNLLFLTEWYRPALLAGLPSSRTGLLPSSPLRTVHESFRSHSSSPSNASFGETRFRDRNALTVNPVMALWMK